LENSVTTGVLFLFLLLIKHSVADLWLQGRFTNKYGDKKNLTDLKLWVHSLDHAVLTAAITLLFAGLWWAIIIAVLDFVLHSVIDYVKRIYILRNNITAKQHLYWKIQSVDQALHYTCYFVYVLIIF